MSNNFKKHSINHCHMLVLQGHCPLVGLLKPSLHVQILICFVDVYQNHGVVWLHWYWYVKARKHTFLGMSSMDCACSYASLTQDRIMERPNHSSKMSPSAFIIHSTVKVKRSSEGFNEHSCSQRSLELRVCTYYMKKLLGKCCARHVKWSIYLGNIGITVWTR